MVEETYKTDVSLLTDIYLHIHPFILNLNHMIKKLSKPLIYASNTCDQIGGAI